MQSLRLTSKILDVVIMRKSTRGRGLERSGKGVAWNNIGIKSLGTCRSTSLVNMWYTVLGFRREM